jgi:hypothetical protein
MALDALRRPFIVVAKDLLFSTGVKVWVTVTVGEAAECGTAVIFCTAGGGEVGPVPTSTSGQENF